MANMIGSGSDSIRTLMLLLLAYRWIPGSGRGVELGKLTGVGVAVARPRRRAWPRLRAAAFVAFVTLISCVLHEECHGGAGWC